MVGANTQGLTVVTAGPAGTIVRSNDPEHSGKPYTDSTAPKTLPRSGNISSSAFTTRDSSHHSGQQGAGPLTWGSEKPEGICWH